MSENGAATPIPARFMSRRQFLQLGLFLVGASWAGTWLQSKLFPAGGAVQEVKPVSFALSELPVGGVKTITYGGVKTIVLRTPQSIRAFSLICTHLGCTVEWQADKKEFYCPCHDGRYDQFGEVIAGPPPVPMEEYKVQITGDQVIVGEV